MSEEKCNTEEDKTPGIFSWRELMTQDTAESSKFYTDLLGWTKETMPMPDGSDYTMFMNGNMPVAGMIKPPAEAPSAWNNYITVKDLDATLAKAQELGANVIMPATDVPEKGRFAFIVDPQGASIGFWQFV